MRAVHAAIPQPQRLAQGPIGPQSVNRDARCRPALSPSLWRPSRTGSQAGLRPVPSRRTYACRGRSGVITAADDAADSRTEPAGGPDGRTLNP
jgi:hypothetical protein